MPEKRRRFRSFRERLQQRLLQGLQRGVNVDIRRKTTVDRFESYSLNKAALKKLVDAQESRLDWAQGTQKKRGWYAAYGWENAVKQCD